MKFFIIFPENKIQTPLKFLQRPNIIFSSERYIFIPSTFSHICVQLSLKKDVFLIPKRNLLNWGHPNLRLCVNHRYSIISHFVTNWIIISQKTRVVFPIFWINTFMDDIFSGIFNKYHISYFQQIATRYILVTPTPVILLSFQSILWRRKGRKSKL